MLVQTLLAFLGLALGVVAAGHALLYKRKPQSAFGWIALSLALPYAGALLYYLFGINRVKTRARKLRSGRRREDSPQQSAVQPPRGLESLARLGFTVTGLPLVGGNRIAPLHNGEQAYPAMLDAIRQASRQVVLSSYIFDHDSVGERFAAALGDAVARGVDVRVLLDGIGELYSFPPVRRLLEQQGVRYAQFLPPRLVPPTLQINLRNHRKILIADDDIAFVGGMNIGERHLADTDDPARVVDMHFGCRGPIVAQIKSVFADDWRFVTGESLPFPPFNPSSHAPTGDASCRAIADGPEAELDRLAHLLIGAIGVAQQRLLIMTPYFVPPREVMSALQVAALRGIEVAVILPAQNNLPFVHRATRHLLWELLQRGVRIYYQPPPFVHSRLLVVDGQYALIGSANMDARSLRLNFELTVEVYDPTFANELAQHFETVRDRSRPITLSEVDHRPFGTRLVDGVAWLFSPYL
jgi:cardiolipin synthase